MRSRITLTIAQRLCGAAHTTGLLTDKDTPLNGLKERKRIDSLDIDNGLRAYKEVVVWCLRLIGKAHEKKEIAEGQTNEIQKQILRVRVTAAVSRETAVATVANPLPPPSFVGGRREGQL